MNELNYQLVWRRLSEPYTEWLIAIPVLFALGVLFTIACLRQDKGIGTLLWGFAVLLFVPVLMAYDYKSHGAMPAVELSEWGSGVALLVLFLALVAGSLLLGNFGIGTLALGGVSLVIGALLLVYQLTDGNFPVFYPVSVALSAIGRVPNQYPYESEMVFKCFLGLIVGGFVVNLLREFAVPLAVALVGGGLALLLHIGWVVAQPSLVDALTDAGIKQPLAFQIAPFVLLFFVQCVLSVVRAGLWIGLAIIGGLTVVSIPLAIQLHPRKRLSW